MGMNGASNAIFLLVLLILTIGLNIILTIDNQVDAQALAALTYAGMRPPAQFITLVTNMKNSLISSAQFLMWFMITLNILSSFINSNNLMDYFIGAVTCFLCSAIVLAIGTTLWNGYIVYGGTFLDFTNMQGGLLAVVNNWQALIIANLFACLCSFVWAARGVEAARTGGYNYQG